MRSSWIVLFAAVFIAMMSVYQVNAEAAGDSTKCNSNTVAGHFKCAQSPGNSGQKQQDAKKPTLTSKSTSGTVGMFIKVFLILAVVVALIYFLLRFVNAKTKSFAEGKIVQTIGGTSVGSNRSVQMVKVGERILVVGVGESVSLLKEIDNQEEVERLLEINHREDVIDKSFWKLKDMLTKRTHSVNQERKSFKTMLEGRLKQMAQERKKAMEQLKKKGFGE
ncbi:MAG TPA: flagellar biosynthetic protein FliO [Bacillales bacterium]|nr:flagellar biosynthetic protein FliO [Bacillales bacterium]